MRISAKGRYGIASMIELSWMSREGHHVPVAILAENLGISKIYLEQIFSLLKRSGLVASVKGGSGRLSPGEAGIGNQRLRNLEGAGTNPV